MIFRILLEELLNGSGYHVTFFWWWTEGFKDNETWLLLRDLSLQHRERLLIESDQLKKMKRFLHEFLGRLFYRSEIDLGVELLHRAIDVESRHLTQRVKHEGLRIAVGSTKKYFLRSVGIIVSLQIVIPNLVD